jgi:hypothetical protein
MLVIVVPAASIADTVVIFVTVCAVLNFANLAESVTVFIGVRKNHQTANLAESVTVFVSGTVYGSNVVTAACFPPVLLAV